MNRLYQASDLRALWEKIIPMLLVQSEKLTIAESFTGGMLVSSLTQISGVSSFFRGGIVAYQEDLKRGMLGVEAVTLEHFGVVSTQVAEEMALGVLQRFQGTIGLGTTGLAGPARETPLGEKSRGPSVGTVALAVALGGKHEERVCSRLLHLSGDRYQVQLQGSCHLLELLADQLM